jgi:phosphate-selective porin OprO/OprP
VLPSRVDSQHHAPGGHGVEGFNRALPGQNSNLFSSGAWQVGIRYCWTNLTNNGINGGQVHEVTVGLNWFWNLNMKIQWNYDIGYRGDLGPGSTSNGTFQGFGTRFAFDF